jgi:O-antigen/teichoic acid export membrane protein
MKGPIRLPRRLADLPGLPGMTGGSWALLSLTLAMGTGAARALIAAHLIGAREVGTVGVALLVLATLDALTATAGETALVSHPGDPEADLDPAFTLRVAQGVLVAGLLWLGAPAVGRFFEMPAVPPLMRALALVPLLRGLSNPAAILLVRRIEFRRLFWWGLPEAVAGTALVVGVGVVRRDAWALVAAVVGAQAVSTVVSYAMAPRVPRLAVRGPGFARLLHYGRWMQGTRVLMFAALNLDNFVVGKVLGAAALGFYQIAFRIGEIPAVTVGHAAARAMLPVLTRLRRRPSRLRREYLGTFRLVMAVNAAIALGLVLAARPAVAWLLGPEWLPAVPLAQILAAAMLFRTAAILANQLFYALERPRFVFAVNAVRVGVLALTIYPLLRLMGTPGVAVSVLLSSLAAALLCVAGTRAALGAKPGAPLPAPAER